MLGVPEKPPLAEFTLKVIDDGAAGNRLRKVTPPPPATVRVPFAAGAATRYRVEGRVFTETGERAIGPIEEVGEVCLLPIV